MKRLIALALCVLLLVPTLGLTASADQQTGMDAYIDANGRAVCVAAGQETVLPFDGVQDIVFANDTVIYLTARTLEGTTALFAWSPLLSTQNSSVLVAAVSGKPVYVAHDNAIYFLSAENPRQLMKCEPRLSGQSTVVRLLPSANCELREAMDGLSVSVGTPGAAYYSRILDAESNMLRPAQFDPEADWQNFGDFETQLTSEGGLELRKQGETAWNFVSYDNVTAQAAMDGKLYYLMAETDGTTWLASYDPSATQDQLTYQYRFNSALQPVLAAEDGVVFTIDNYGSVQAYEPASGRFLGNWTASAQQASMKLCADKLLVYETMNGMNALRLKAELPWKQAKTYAPLAAGSRGEDVRALQARLNELGYNAGRADGVYGANTQNAVIYFEDAVGMTQDGAASPELQQKLFAANAPAYAEYVELSRGVHTGVRVRKLQERLRELGYLADRADGVYGGRTQTAVTLFQSENGLRATGVATVETQRRLMSRDAAVCSSYIPLRRGDTGVRVTELQERLRELGYLVQPANGEYDSATGEAVRLFCQMNDLREQTQADESIQRAIYSRNAATYDGYIVLKYGDSGERVLNIQKRLTELGYYAGEQRGNYRSLTREAVRLFQQWNGLNPDGVSTIETQEKLFSAWAIPYTAPTAEPTAEPTAVPTAVPTAAPTAEPTAAPTAEPTAEPTPGPVVTPEPTATPIPGPKDQNVSEEAIQLMVDWMDENYYGYGDLDKWTDVDVINWIQTALYVQDYLSLDDYAARQDGIYDLATKNAVEAFQRHFEIGKNVQNYEYGVADGETLQKLWDELPEEYK